MPAPAVGAILRLVVVEAAAWGLQESIQDYAKSLDSVNLEGARLDMLDRAAQEICERDMTFQEFVAAVEMTIQAISQWPLGLNSIANSVPTPTHGLYLDLRERGGCLRSEEQVDMTSVGVDFGRKYEVPVDESGMPLDRSQESYLDPLGPRLPELAERWSGSALVLSPRRVAPLDNAVFVLPGALLLGALLARLLAR